MTHTIIMPDLGQTTSEGKVLKWLKSPGERLDKGEALVEVETDKATMEVETYAEGYLREVMAQKGEMVAAMAPIAILTDTLDEPYERPGAKAAGPSSTGKSASSIPAAPAPAQRRGAVAPAARTLAKELGIDVNLVPGTGPGGLVTRVDVERFGASQKLAAQDP